MHSKISTTALARLSAVKFQVSRTRSLLLVLSRLYRLEMLSSDPSLSKETEANSINF